jgi:hypothetical protein
MRGNTPSGPTIPGSSPANIVKYTGNWLDGPKRLRLDPPWGLSANLVDFAWYMRESQLLYDANSRAVE